MALTEHERNSLEQLEKQFRDEDPQFATAMEPERARSRSALHVVIGAATAVAGFLLVLLGAALPGLVPNIVVGVLGFATMIAGGHSAVKGTPGTRGEGPAPAAQHAGPVGSKEEKKERRSFRDGVGDMALWSLFWWV
ncbi:DUF3040 domain-containing protein [Arthrobacter sp. MDT3-24]